MSAEKKLWLRPHITSHRIESERERHDDENASLAALKVLSAIWKIGNDARERVRARKCSKSYIE